jgi:hypothetical protein
VLSLSLARTNGGGRVGAIMSLSDQAPLSVKDIPERVLEMSIVVLFVLFPLGVRVAPVVGITHTNSNLKNAQSMRLFLPLLKAKLRLT